MSTFARCFSISSAMWPVLPTPGEPQLSWPGLARAAASRSAIDLNPVAGFAEHDVRDVGNMRNGREILLGIEWRTCVHEAIDRERPRRPHHQRVAVGCGACHLAGADVAAGARLVLDDDTLAERAAQSLGHDAGEQIGRAARCERHDDAQRTCSARTRPRVRRDAVQQPDVSSRPQFALPRRHHPSSVSFTLTPVVACAGSPRRLSKLRPDLGKLPIMPRATDAFRDYRRECDA